MLEKMKDIIEKRKNMPKILKKMVAFEVSFMCS